MAHLFVKKEKKNLEISRWLVFIKRHSLIWDGPSLSVCKSRRLWLARKEMLVPSVPFSLGERKRATVSIIIIIICGSPEQLQ